MGEARSRILCAGGCGIGALTGSGPRAAVIDVARDLRG